MSTTEQYSIDSSAVIAALAPALLTKCSTENTEYMKCKSKSENPEDCLKESINCRKCVFSLASEFMNSPCQPKFSTLVECLRKREYDYKDCYPQRSAFESCAHHVLGVEFRPPVNPKIE
ncbi:NADH-ubiquinone oxidoreductase [Naegleria gruberi]|uniref:NADH-ubiquinone oxidoreductase n=1 Tax=Naegleria gruberi TaxID=5762 RepID=D2VD48_NAEGR|nr:NADH-ubiquinone oxidoreductase [Naegleria gruberi]EFC45267.1 NADH-ubiquinone oxidoreductase [Naegleria gruberi]|eukprot:XP_002678011.1 NADH-ubiquinone oxidoreductase [Naegleria gruberi strain NEG-M]